MPIVRQLFHGNFNRILLALLLFGMVSIGVFSHFSAAQSGGGGSCPLSVAKNANGTSHIIVYTNNFGDWQQVCADAEDYAKQNAAANCLPLLHCPSTCPVEVGIPRVTSYSNLNCLYIFVDDSMPYYIEAWGSARANCALTCDDD